ncbi:hypothetical protein HID58_061207 [Brassica napus]|uniref:(rape) hypothetical protein n=1 Tax=Brassica napus TaxID=3708 RepID=A0A816JIL0_BRANA|nr:uncharacterized protein LOC106393714 [Brassica napus]KAH0885111.1 hypothetical protein HID58_061207 [Brassica napus]CAF1855258.1 unnamed protein product [Brassica napus]
MSIMRTSLQDGRFIRAKTIAFWDINACQIPDGLGAGVISESVNQTLMNMNYYGELCLRLYGDTDMDKLVPTYHTFDFCGLPHTTILEQILVDLYGDTLFNRGTQINMLLIVGDLSKDKAIIDAFSLLPKSGWVNVLVCQPSAVEAAVFSSEVQLPPWEKIVETAFAICEKKEKERVDYRKEIRRNTSQS